MCVVQQMRRVVMVKKRELAKSLSLSGCVYGGCIRARVGFLVRVMWESQSKAKQSKSKISFETYLASKLKKVHSEKSEKA